MYAPHTIDNMSFSSAHQHGLNSGMKLEDVMQGEKQDYTVNDYTVEELLGIVESVPAFQNSTANYKCLRMGV